MRTLYAYVDGSDLHDHEDRLAEEFDALARRWVKLGATSVNQQHERTSDMLPDDLHDWILGINLPLHQFGKEQAKELIPFLRNLARSTEHEFVVGVAEESGVTEDLLFVSADADERDEEELLQHLAGI